MKMDNSWQSMNNPMKFLMFLRKEKELKQRITQFNPVIFCTASLYARG